MNLRQNVPCAAEINAVSHQVIVGANAGAGMDVGKPNPQCLTALLSAMGVQHDVPGDPEDPGPGIIVMRRHLIETAPENQHGVGYNVFGNTGISAPLNEPQEIRVHRSIQRTEGVGPVRARRRITHTHTCPSPAQVCRTGERTAGISRASRIKGANSSLPPRRCRTHTNGLVPSSSASPNVVLDTMDPGARGGTGSRLPATKGLSSWLKHSLLTRSAHRLAGATAD
jgi:hypothetical protein